MTPPTKDTLSERLRQKANELTYSSIDGTPALSVTALEAAAALDSLQAQLAGAQKQLNVTDTELKSLYRELKLTESQLAANGAEIASDNLALATAKAEVERLNKAMAEMRDMLGVTESYPLIGVLNRLALAAKHLLHSHDCDHEGHEQIAHCVKLAEDYSNKYHALSRAASLGVKP